MPENSIRTTHRFGAPAKPITPDPPPVRAAVQTSSSAQQNNPGIRGSEWRADPRTHPQERPEPGQAGRKPLTRPNQAGSRMSNTPTAPEDDHPQATRF